MKSVLLLSLPMTAVVLAACSTHHGPGYRHAGAADPCAAHRAAGTPEQRRAAAEAHIVQMHGSATPEHIERHLQMMEQRCAAAGDGAKRGT